MTLSDWKAQARAIWQVTFSPRRGLLDLPSKRLWPMSFLISFYFAYGRSLRLGTFGEASEALGSTLGAFALALILSIPAFCLAGAVVYAVVRLVGKKLTYWRVLNVLGYAQAPRLFVSLPLSIGMWLLPEPIRTDMLWSLLSPIGILIALAGGILLLYSVVLLVWGLVLSPDERPAPVGPRIAD